MLTLAASFLFAPVQDLSAQLDGFFSARSHAERESAAADIVASDAPFDDVLAGLRAGREYSRGVDRGRLLRERKGTNGLRHPYLILVPEDYDPEQRWPVRVDLHGGMGAKEWKRLDGSWNPGWERARGQIVVVPAGWWDSMWWEWSQVENLEAILREVRETWNIDENRVVMYGSSDGGAALYFHAMRQPDRFAGFCGHVAPPDRLVRADFRIDGQMHLSNLRDQRFHLGFGERDRKVPLVHLRRYMELFEQQGAELDWYVLEGQGHGLSLPEERERQLGRFLWRTIRDPLPDRVTWSTERVDRYRRRSWLVIDRLSATQESVDESNLLPRWGTRIQLAGPTTPRAPWGRVSLERNGNTVVGETRGVDQFTLLISPDEFQLDQPIRVEVDGQVRFEGRLEPSIATLLKWAIVDDDRSCLFAAELVIELD